MKKIILLLLIMLQSWVFGQDLPTIAIMAFEGRGMSEMDASNIADQFSYELSKANKFTITEREMMNTILKEQEFQLSGCTSSECVVEIGQLVGVRYIIAGTVSKTFDLYSMHVRMIDVGSGKVITQIRETYEGSAKDFMTSTVRNVALKLAAEAGTGVNAGAGTIVQTSVTRTGSVVFTLNTSPVNVFIDGAFSGENPNNTVSLSLPMGDHSIKFTSQGFLDYTKTITIIPDESISYTVDMEKGSSGIVSQITTGIVVIRSEPQGAKVFLDGREIGNTPVQIPKAGAGKHILTVSKQLYHDHREEINVEADGIVQVMASLIPSFGALTVTSEPADAVVKLNDQIMGRTPLSLNQLASGDYTLNLSKDLYHDYEEKFIITDGSENNKPIKLHPAFGRLRVTGYPENAKVFINGQLRGNAPLDLPEMPSGTYSLRIEEELYATEEMQVTVEDGMTESAGFQLPPRFGTLNISGSPVGAQVFLNNKAIGELPINKLKIEAGLVEIKVSAKDYHEKILFQQINVGENVNVEVELRPHTGTLVVMTTPPGARVSLNDKQYGESPQIIKELRIGTYQLAVTHPDYLDIHENFNLALNQRKEFNFPLITYSGSIQQQIDQRRKYQLMNIAGSAIIGLIAGGLELYSQSLWKDYEIAMDTEEVERLFEQSNTFHKNAGIVSAVAMLSLSPTVYFQFDIHKLAGKLK